MIPPEFAALVRKVAAGLDGLDYFQVLRVSPDASMEAIRAAYHQQARFFHPDKYRHLGADDLLADLNAIAKRVAEAYTILRDDKKRQRYQKDLAGPDRKNKLRYTEQSEADEQRDAQVATTPQGQQLYAQATLAWANGDRERALQSLKMALVYESGNATLKAKLQEWQTAAAPR